MEDIIPSHILQEAFPRPFDVKLSAKKMDEFIKMHGKHVKKKILVVDDSGAMLRNVKGWLEDKYQVILANSGAMAIKYLATNRPDLLKSMEPTQIMQEIDAFFAKQIHKLN